MQLEHLEDRTPWPCLPRVAGVPGPAMAGGERIPDEVSAAHAGRADRRGGETAVAVRLLMYPSETYRVPRSCRAVRVRTGMAWLTHAGRDIVLGEGEAVEVDGKRDVAVVSSVSGAPLVLEVLAMEPRRSARR